MAKYFPIKMIVEVSASRSEMIAFYWRSGSVVADFAIPQDNFSSLRVRFNRADIIRSVDEMLISTEEDQPNEGMVRDHLAYRVEDSLFWKSQSETFRFIHKNALHYRFITAGQCLDVVSAEPPLLTVVPFDIGPQQNSE